MHIYIYIYQYIYIYVFIWTYIHLFCIRNKCAAAAEARGNQAPAEIEKARVGGEVANSQKGVSENRGP